ncbi:MAG: phosphotransferase family protein [Bryobacteraceae bacterium]
MIAEQQLKQILARALPTHRLVSFEQVKGGLRNTIYRLHVDGWQDALALRVYSQSHSTCQKEIELHRLVSGVIPVPEIVYADPVDDDFGPHILMRWMPGVPYRHIKSSGNAQEIAEASHSIGAMLARLRRVAFPRIAGGVHSVPVFIESCLNSAALQQRLESHHREGLRKFVRDRARQLSDLTEEPHLVHADFSSRNILLDRVAGRWTVTGVIDWEGAFSGCQLYDVGSILRYEWRSQPRMEPHFSNGYRESGGVLPGNWRELARAVDLVDLCKGLTHPDLPAGAACEIAQLVMDTVEGHESLLLS